MNRLKWIDLLLFRSKPRIIRPKNMRDGHGICIRMINRLIQLLLNNLLLLTLIKRFLLGHISRRITKIMRDRLIKHLRRPRTSVQILIDVILNQQGTRANRPTELLRRFLRSPRRDFIQSLLRLIIWSFSKHELVT